MIAIGLNKIKMNKALIEKIARLARIEVLSNVPEKSGPFINVPAVIKGLKR